MFIANEYFDGKVKSIGFETSEGKATIGVIAAGEYEFGTSTIEYMTVTSGKLTVLLPGSDEWKDFGQNETFKVESDVKFQIKAEEAADRMPTAQTKLMPIRSTTCTQCRALCLYRRDIDRHRFCRRRIVLTYAPLSRPRAWCGISC